MRERLADKAEVRRWRNGRCRGARRLSHMHEAMAHALLADPSITQRELGKQFRRTPGWVSQILASDAFRAHLAKRAAKFIDPLLYATVKDYTENVHLWALELLSEKLERPVQDIPDNLIVRTLEVTGRVT